MLLCSATHINEKSFPWGSALTIAVGELALSEYQALHDLYDATGGPSWVWPEFPVATVWNFSDQSDPCVDHWQGVTCANTTSPNHVTRLDLHQLNLVGSLPASIGNFSAMTQLALFYNLISGQLPPTMANLLQLETLDLRINLLTGPFPDWVCSLSKLEELLLEDNTLSGTIPEDISNLTELLYFDVYSNAMTGLIPESIGALSKLQELWLGSDGPDPVYNSSVNAFSGPLPASFGKLAALEVLNLNFNQFSGPLPDSFGKLKSLQILQLSASGWSGQLPAFIANLTALQTLDVGHCAFSGTIPSELFALPDVTVMLLWDNHFNGSIPSMPGSASALYFLYLQENHLTGHVPLNFIDGSQLVQLYLDTNLLSGNISFVGGLPLLQELSAHGNKFTGCIPKSVARMTQIVSLELQDNLLMGSIPDDLYDLTVLFLLNLADNALTGTLSPRIGDLYMQSVNLSHNNFVGSIPTELKVEKMSLLALAENAFTGTIPPVLSNAQIQVLDLHNNQLTGTVPSLITFVLHVLLLHGNQLTGALSDVFTAAPTTLYALRLDGNQFTGELPAFLFQPSLISLSIVGSCLHGSLPDNICDATQLQALILYGLTTGDSCRATGLKALAANQQNFGSKFPRCLLELPSLETLLLSSNRLTGRMSDDWTVGSNLKQLDLSHNRLSGPLPSTIQNHSFSLLDLSHNKLSGNLDDSLFATAAVYEAADPRHAQASTQAVAPSPELYLSSNRLSGGVPESVMSVEDISILAGNLFQCHYGKSDLPQHDTALDTYECASNSFNVAMYIWLGLVILVPIAVAAWYYYVGQRVQWTFPLVQLPDELAGRLTDMYSVLESYHVIYKSCWCCAVLALCVLLPYYVVVSHFEGTHTQQYAYVLSCIYTSGVVPFTLNVVFWTAVLVALYYSTFLRHLKCEVTHTTQATWELWRSRAQVMLVYTLTSVAVVLGANVAFVYGILYGDSTYQIAYQIALSLFKLAWSNVLSPIMVRRLDLFFSASEDDKPRHFFALQLLVSMFNNIAIPCLVVMAIDPNCFSSILVPPSAKEVDFLLPTCVSTGVVYNCEEIVYSDATLEFTPPFSYSFQCSASFVTSYAATFIYSSLACIILNPLLKRTLCLVHGRTAPGTFIHKAISMVLPRIFHPLEQTPPSARSLRLRPIAGAVGVLVNLLTQWGTLLTFGVVFPPIALAMAVSITVGVYDTRNELQNFLRRVTEEGKLGYLDLVNEECAGVGTAEHVLLAVKLIVCYCCAFYTLFLFDALGDTQGFRASWWVLIVFPVLPFIVLGSVRVYRDYVVGLEPAGGSIQKAGLDEAREISMNNRASSTDGRSVVSVLHENSA